MALGAEEISGAELVRRLVASGLRIPATHRPGKLDEILTQRFSRLFPGTSPEREPVVADPLARWSEPHRHYNNRSHLLGTDLLVRHGDWTRKRSDAV